MAFDAEVFLRRPAGACFAPSGRGQTCRTSTSAAQRTLPALRTPMLTICLVNARLDGGLSLRFAMAVSTTPPTQ
jgi:hypothetical protein